MKVKKQKSQPRSSKKKDKKNKLLLKNKTIWLLKFLNVN